MAAKSTTTDNLVLNFLLGGATATAPAGRYVALLTGVTSIPAATVTEVSGGSYARQSCAWNAASGGSATNSSALTFTALPSCTLTNFAIYDAATAGNLLYVGTMTSQAVSAGNGVSVAAGALTVSES